MERQNSAECTLALAVLTSEHNALIEHLNESEYKLEQMENDLEILRENSQNERETLTALSSRKEEEIRFFKEKKEEEINNIIQKKNEEINNFQEKKEEEILVFKENFEREKNYLKTLLHEAVEENDQLRSEILEITEAFDQSQNALQGSLYTLSEKEKVLAETVTILKIKEVAGGTLKKQSGGLRADNVQMAKELENLMEKYENLSEKYELMKEELINVRKNEEILRKNEEILQGNVESMRRNEEILKKNEENILNTVRRRDMEISERDLRDIATATAKQSTTLHIKSLNTQIEQMRDGLHRCQNDLESLRNTAQNEEQERKDQLLTASKQATKLTLALAESSILADHLREEMLTLRVDVKLAEDAKVNIIQLLQPQFMTLTLTWPCLIHTLHHL